ncbi:MAG: uroporphyrinogen-III C-methyltransferase [Acidiferrobacterales bacterium]|nr:uroporphyrinogen-III C-methyltransferase [Acidiferrobacterales bacterium]
MSNNEKDANQKNQDKKPKTSESNKNSTAPKKKRGKKKTGARASRNNDQKTSKRSETTMTTSADANTATPKDAAPANTEAVAATAVYPPQPSQSSGKGLGWLALFVSLVALGGAGYSWYQTAVNAKLSGGEQSNRIANIEQRVDDFGQEQSGVAGLIDQIQQRVSGAETGVADQVSQVKQLVGSTETALVSQISEVKQQLAKSESTMGDQISEVKQQIAKTESAVSEQIRAIRTENTEQQAAVTEQVAAADAGLQEQTSVFRTEFDQLTSSIEALRGELGTSISGWTLREIEHLLVMANQRLQLGSSASDAQTALSALQIADQRLKELDDPRTIETRQILSAEMAALSAIEAPDITAISSSIGLLSSTLGDLPMKGTDKPAGPTKPESDGAAPTGATAQEKITNAGRSFLTDLASLVQVEKGGEPILANIAPEIQTMQLAQGQLILEAAQVALVREQADIFTERLTAAEAWVGKHIVAESPQTSSWLQQLGEAKQVPLSVSYPDISGSLASLRSVIGTEG